MCVPNIVFCIVLPHKLQTTGLLYRLALPIFYQQLVEACSSLLVSASISTLLVNAALMSWSKKVTCMHVHWLSDSAGACSNALC